MATIVSESFVLTAVRAFGSQRQTEPEVVLALRQIRRVYLQHRRVFSQVSPRRGNPGTLPEVGFAADPGGMLADVLQLLARGGVGLWGRAFVKIRASQVPSSTTFFLLSDLSPYPLDFEPFRGARTELQLSSNHTRTPSTQTTPSRAYDGDCSSLEMLPSSSPPAVLEFSLLGVFKPIRECRRTTTSFDFTSSIGSWEHRKADGPRPSYNPPTSYTAHVHHHSSRSHTYSRLPVVCGRTRPPTPLRPTPRSSHLHDGHMLLLLFILRALSIRVSEQFETKSGYKSALESSSGRVSLHSSVPSRMDLPLDICTWSSTRKSADGSRSSLAALKVCCKAAMEWYNGSHTPEFQARIQWRLGPSHPQMSVPRLCWQKKEDMTSEWIATEGGWIGASRCACDSICDPVACSSIYLSMSESEDRWQRALVARVVVARMRMQSHPQSSSSVSPQWSLPMYPNGACRPELRRTTTTRDSTGSERYPSSWNGRVEGPGCRPS
ncbi:hypothetical protein C8R46DRAFT_1222466 [Mycena filopes]|nr:hypothetical protein C8R46DRAFT_1222466 [Mycena filopes]